MSKLYLMTGLSGVGKTTVINKARELGADFESVNYGDVMVKVAQDKEIVDSRDELKYLGDDEQRHLQEFTVKYLENLEGKVLVDTHFALETRKGYLPGIPKTSVPHFKNVQGILIIEAPAEEIAKRRKLDEGVRERMAQQIDELNEQLEMDRAYAAILSFWFSRPLKIIQNTDLDNAAKELADFLK